MRIPIRIDIKYLKQKSEEIIFNGIESEPCEETARIIKELEDSLDLTKGIGLTAIQIGIPKRIAIIRMPRLKLNLINPILLEKYDKFRFKGEKCLSLPGLVIDTARYKDIVIKNENGKKLSFYGLQAVCVQHEIDHFNGILIIDRKWRKRR
jgi:peptide deformylase